MRILCAAHDAGRAGGVESYLSTVLPALVSAGHDVSCWFETSRAGREPIVSAGVRVWTGDGAPEPLAPIARWAPDVLYVHGLRCVETERALQHLAPAAFFAHSYYGTCISGHKMTVRPAIAVCERRFGAACLAHFYPRGCGGRHPLTMIRQYRLQADRLALLGRYGRILVASQHMAREYGRHGLGAKVEVVPLPIASVTAPARERGASEPWRLLYLGRLERTKGALVALESAAIVAESSPRPVVLQVSGEGSLAGAIRTRANALGAVRNLRVEITGWLNEAARADAFDRADVLLLPSLWPEPFGLVGPEAAAHGVPAVAFAVGGVPEWLTDGVNGRLVSVDPPYPRRFAAAVTDCLADPCRLARMRERSLAAADTFSLQRHLTRLVGVLEQVAGQRAGAPQ
jgi:glycosyltransferase involved in cell wall biosynthesis